MTTEKAKTTRQRSTNYPSIDLALAENVIQRAHSSGITNRTALAQLVGHQDDTSGPARTKLAALKRFGLVDYQEGKVIITELGKRIAAPMPGEDPSEALRESFLNVASFKQMHDLCGKGIALPKDKLASIAIRQVNIVPKVAPEFVDIFARSGVTAGLVELVDENSLRVLSEPLATKQEQKAEAKIAAVSKQAQTLNISVNINVPIDPEDLRKLIKVLKEELQT